MELITVQLGVLRTITYQSIIKRIFDDGGKREAFDPLRRIQSRIEIVALTIREQLDYDTLGSRLECPYLSPKVIHDV